MELKNRKATGLKGYDYSAPGAYFITICTKGRKNLLSEITVGQGLAPALRYLMLSVRLNHSSFHNHIIQCEKDYQKIWEYIDANVIRWKSCAE